MGVPGLFGWVSRKFKKSIEKPPWNPQYQEQKTTPLRNTPNRHRNKNSKHKKDSADDEATDAVPTDGETKESTTAATLDDRPPFEFDNLYLDLNGTIHPSVRRCVVDGKLDFDAFFTKFCLEIRDTVKKVNPLKVLFLAVDGVAPRAKMAQQRKRRFVKGQDAKADTKVKIRLINELRQRGLATPTLQSVETTFDTNVISPGTTFMVRVANEMHVWAQKMITENTDNIWGRLAVIVSDGTVPGEGEHKALRFIRSQRTTPGYDPNTRHCIEGLDADMMLLALATHELHVTVLRPEHTDYKKHEAEIVRIDTIRRYMEIEFEKLRHKISFQFDLERCIDDFILCCSLVGNDFLPHLPSIRITDGALDLLLELYKQVLTRSNGYLTMNGKVNIQSNGMSLLLQATGEVEKSIFEQQDDGRRRRRRGPVAWKDRKGKRDTQIDAMLKDKHSLGIRFLLKSLNGKERASLINSISTPDLQCWVDDNAATGYLWIFKPQKVMSYLAQYTKENAHDNDNNTGETKADTSKDDFTVVSTIRATGECLYSSTLNMYTSLKKVVAHFFDNELEVELDAITAIQRIQLQKNDSSTLRFQEEADRIAYYSQFFKDSLPEANVNPNAHAEEIAARVADEYVRGMCWALEYYLSDVPSWKWLYPFHFAPLAVDMAAAMKRTENPLKRLCTFEQGTQPTTPIGQLLCVLPRSSSDAIPNAKARELMHDCEGPLNSSFVDAVRYDTRNEEHKWKWTAVFPFASPDIVQKAMTQRGIVEKDHGVEHIYMLRSHPFVQRLLSEREKTLAASTSVSPSLTKSSVVVEWVDGRTDATGSTTPSVCLTSIPTSIAIFSGKLRGNVPDAGANNNNALPVVCDFVWEDDLNLLSSFYAKTLEGAKLSPIAASITTKDVATYRLKRNVTRLVGGGAGGGGRGGGGSGGGRRGSGSGRRNRGTQGICYQFQKGGCSYGDKCKYSHKIGGSRGGSGESKNAWNNREEISSAPHTDTETTNERGGDEGRDSDAERRISAKREKKRRARRRKKEKLARKRREQALKSGSTSAVGGSQVDASGEATAGTQGDTTDGASSTTSRANKRGGGLATQEDA